MNQISLRIGKLNFNPSAVWFSNTPRGDSILDEAFQFDGIDIALNRGRKGFKSGLENEKLYSLSRNILIVNLSNEDFQYYKNSSHYRKRAGIRFTTDKIDQFFFDTTLSGELSKESSVECRFQTSWPMRVI